MKPQVVMSPNNGFLCVAIPLYQLVDHEVEGNYQIRLGVTETTGPLFYAMDYGEDELSALSASWVEQNLIFLGDL